ncbi:MAG TPA: glycoside hydrolase family 76 protein [Acidobacteriaceae bacterium]|nr:glycoside hydrolase family 76 protein [Acidobacteriaceae bacterium]
MRPRTFFLPRKLVSIAAAFLVFNSAHTRAQEAQSLNRAELVQQDQLAINTLQASFDRESGLWGKEGWWHDANSLTALVDFSRATGTKQYLPDIERTFTANIGKHFLINKFYDDEGWWALAWIDAYDLTGDSRYLAAAATIFTDMTTGWDDTCGGGLWWTRDRTYKNAIPNELFLSVAAKLANRRKGRQRKKYIAWADREWNWLQHSAMVEPDHLFSDGLDSQCHDNHRRKWSYNQGVVLGGLAELSRIPGHSGVLEQAETIADAAILLLSDKNGVVHESCEPACSSDGTQFKGIFMRNLAELNQLSNSPRYAGVLRVNATSIIENAQGPDHSFGIVWSGPPGKTTLISQTAAIDALNAAVFSFKK